MSAASIIITISAITIAITAILSYLFIKGIDGLDTITKKISTMLTIFIISAMVVLCLFRGMFVDFVDNYEVGYKFDRRTGQTTILPRTGYFITPPFFVNIHAVDLRPVQVCINTTQRVLNCKLVKFNPAGLHLFIDWHGRADYTIEGSTNNSPSTFAELLKSYAYDGNQKGYPFLTIIRELNASTNAEALPTGEQK